MVQHQMRGITQHFPFQVPEIYLWSSEQILSELQVAFWKCTVIFNHIAEEIGSKTHETFKSDFIP